MGWLEFVASLIKSLVWPATLIFLAVFFRGQLGRALLRLTRLKYKDLELDFGQELKQLEKAAKAINIKPERARKTTVTKRDSSHLLEEAVQLAERFPAPAVAVAWQAVEDELMQAVMRAKISPDYPPHNSALKNAELLKEQNEIDQRTIEILHGMRNLRNLAIHGARSAAEVTMEEAFEFIALAEGVVDKLRQLHRV